jgi:hypothetical protein
MDELKGYEFAIVFAAMWCTISLFIGYMSGWAVLAREFAVEEKPDGESWRLRSANMKNWSSYSGCLTFSISSKGLWLSVFFPFRIGHAPLLIPWNKLTASKEKRFFLTVVKLEALGIPIYLRQSLANQLKESAGENWPRST